MTQDEFLRLAAQDCNRVPVVREVLADLETPLSTYLKLADGAYSYLLESVQGGEKWGRYSIIGLPARTVLRVDGHTATVLTDGVEQERHECADPLAFVEEFKARYRVPSIPGLHRFNGGLVGYFGYDCVRYVEPRLANSVNPDTLGTPDILLMVSDEVVVFDNLAGKLHAIVLADPEQADAFAHANARLDQLLEQLRQPMQPRKLLDLSASVDMDLDYRASFTREDYER
ncbi:MAG: anthranilate synthase component I, partial [Pseudomonas neustonica]